MGGFRMNFLNYVNENTEGLVFIDRLRNTIQNICHEGMKKEFKDVTEDDIDKLTLMLEFNVIDVIRDDEDGIENLSLDDVKNIVDGMIGFHHLLNGVDKNKRESYSEILWDVLVTAFSSVDDIDRLCESSNLVYKYVMINNGEYDGGYSDSLCESDIQECLSEIYKFMLKDKLEF